ncbi:MAG: HD domain-containing protein [Mariprofundales bacterium]
MVYSLSDALDLVGVVQVHHGKRVAYLAAEIGKQIGWPENGMDDLFQAAMLHDCGVANTAVHARLAQFEWEEDLDHCVIGHHLLKSSPPLARLADMVRLHHTHWSELQSMDVASNIAITANCIFLSDRVDVLSLHYQVRDANILMNADKIRQKIYNNRGTWFHPSLVDTFMGVSESEAFWLMLERERIDGYVSEWMGHESMHALSFEEIKSIVAIFSYIVDAKSHYTQEHSQGVANLSRYLGQRLSLSEDVCDTLELAGMLHDLGKLRVPDVLLDKPGKLTPEEFRTIQRHSFDTAAILKSIKGFEKVTEWAGQHHERLSGEGYPFHHTHSKISLEARIIAVADVFQALAQDRPYRDSIPKQRVLSILDEDVASGKLDGEVVKLVKTHLDACWDAALCIAK